MDCGRSVTAVREGFHGVWSVCHSSARELSWGVNGMSQTRERITRDCGRSVADVREGSHGVWCQGASYCGKKLCIRCAISLLWAYAEIEID